MQLPSRQVNNQWGDYADFLLCPSCKYNLTLESSAVVCKNCRKSFSIQNDIPCFVAQQETSAEETRRSFDLQWEMSRIRGEYNQFNQDYRKKLVRYFLEDTMLPADYFNGKKALDAGCGVGRLSYALSQLGADVVAVDYNDNAARITAEYFRGHPRVKVLQADIFNLPLCEKYFDFIVAFGVLHHTGDTKKAFDKLVPLLKDGGILFVMVYEKYNPFKLWLTDQVRIITVQMNKQRLYRLSIALSKICKYGIFRIPLKPFIDIGYSAEGNYDALAKAINQHHTVEELHSWYIKHGFSEIMLNSSRKFNSPLFRFLQGRWGGTLRMRGTKTKGININEEKLQFVSSGSRRHI